MWVVPDVVEVVYNSHVFVDYILRQLVGIALIAKVMSDDVLIPDMLPEKMNPVA